MVRWTSILWFVKKENNNQRGGGLTVYVLSMQDLVLTAILCLWPFQFYTQVMASDRLTMTLLPAGQGGRLMLSLSADGTDMISESGFDLADNRWHDVDLRFHEDFLQMRLDGQWTPVVNSTLVNRSPLFQRTVGDNSERSVTLGGGFTGCLLEGPSLTFASMADQDVPINCPIPLGNNSQYPSFINPTLKKWPNLILVRGNHFKMMKFDFDDRRL